MYLVYMVKNSADKLYIGVTENPNKRIQEHNSKRGAYFTRENATYEIVFLEQHTIFADARKREVQIKKWRREKKEMLIERYLQGLDTKP